ncbi:hypothetical protein R1sor_007962 [Riccia sorocarpa]|uniref:Uncharacterized protein n=1 Tax=Riccia sorocarpa TaxID=122646 RepID=A0ABD3HU66_9MARC
MVKEELIGHLKDFREQLRDVLDHTPMETLSRGQIMDRWNLPGRVSPVQRCVTLAGDAFHPMTPNLGILKKATQNSQKYCRQISIRVGNFFFLSIRAAVHSDRIMKLNELMQKREIGIKVLSLLPYAGETRIPPVTVSETIYRVRESPSGTILARPYQAVPALLERGNIMVNTFYDLGSKPIDSYQNYSSSPSGTSAPRVPFITTAMVLDVAYNNSMERTLSWLDGQPAFSVLCLAFGAWLVCFDHRSISSAWLLKAVKASGACGCYPESIVEILESE